MQTISVQFYLQISKLQSMQNESQSPLATQFPYPEGY